MDRGIRDDLIDSRNPSIAGILTGACKGECWIGPSIAVAYSYPVGGCGIIGDSIEEKREEVRDFFEKQVFQGLEEQGIHEFEFSVEEEELRKEILRLFSDKEIKSEDEYSYRRKEQIECTYTVSQGIQIRKVDARFLEALKEAPISNSEMILRRIKDAWENELKFLEQSTAYVAMNEEEIMGVIMGSARYKNYVSVDIEVSKKYRKQGLATALTTEFVNECCKNNIVIQWDHVASNTASKALAEKSGFQLFKVRPYYWFQIT